MSTKRLEEYKKDIYRCIHCKACKFSFSGTPDKKDELEGTEAPFVSHLVELRDRLVRPSIDLEEIEERHRAVAELVDDPSLLQRLQAALEGLPDLQRLAARVERLLRLLQTGSRAGCGAGQDEEGPPC